MRRFYTERTLWLELGLLVVLILIGLCLGAVNFPLSHFVCLVDNAVHAGRVQCFNDWERVIIFELRLPRVVGGAIVGGVLGLAGAAMQGVFRNPLACPSIIGVSSGAALGAVTALFFGLAAQSVVMLPLLAFVGGIISAYAAYRIAVRRGQVSLFTLILAGVAINSLNVALISFIISLSLDGYESGRQIVYWTLGGLDEITWDYVKIAFPLLVVGTGLIIFQARELDALVMGELHAASVGVDVRRVRQLLILGTALVTAAAVSIAGSVGFVGLVVPHVVRIMLGPRHRLLFPASFLGGAIFVVSADILARTIISPQEIRLGVVTAAFGAPFFLFLLVKNTRRAEI